MKIRKTPKTTLTFKEKIFISAYLNGEETVKALKHAKYQMKTDSGYRLLASRILSQPLVQAEISKHVKTKSEEIKITVEKVIRELHHIATSDISQAFDENNRLLDIHSIPENLRRAISAIEVDEIKDRGEVIGYTKKIKFWEKTKSLELLGKHLAMWVDRIAMTGDINLIFGYRKPSQEISASIKESAEDVNVK